LAFRGTFDYSLDVKNRLTVPSRFRAELAAGVVLAKNPYDSCVDVWRPQGYDEFTRSSLAHVGSLNREARRVRRFFASASQETELDAAGRVGVPSFLLQHAGLEKEVVVVGADDHIEIWDRTVWAVEEQKLSDEIPDIAASLGHPA
jgi:MraZ protein